MTSLSSVRQSSKSTELRGGLLGPPLYSWLVRSPGDILDLQMAQGDRLAGLSP